MGRVSGLALVGLFCLALSDRAAADPVLTGEAVQGGMMVGNAPDAQSIFLDGKAVLVAPDGTFLIGFGRNAKAKAELKTVYSDGREKTVTLAIAQRTYKVQRINGLPKKKVTPDPAAMKRIGAENGLIGRVRALTTPEAWFKSGFNWPVKGPISGVYGSQRILNGKPRSPHNGTDVAAPSGTVISAPADGTVRLAHADMFYTGQTVMLDHGLGLTSVYAHMSAILVKDGQFVTQGTPIGKIGKTGRVTGPHLHWGVTWRRTHLDPMLLTGPMPKQ